MKLSMPMFVVVVADPHCIHTYISSRLTKQSVNKVSFVSDGDLDASQPQSTSLRVLLRVPTLNTSRSTGPLLTCFHRTADRQTTSCLAQPIRCTCLDQWRTSPCDTLLQCQHAFRQNDAAHSSTIKAVQDWMTESPMLMAFDCRISHLSWFTHVPGCFQFLHTSGTDTVVLVTYLLINPRRTDS